MHTVIFGNGHLGQAIAAAIAASGAPAPRVLGRPDGAGHRPASLAGCQLAFEASRGDAVAGNVAAALGAGCRAFVIGTTGWERDRDAVERALIDHSAAAVAAPNFSLGVAAFLRVVETAARLFRALDDVDPYVIELHRRGKADRPSGTAREIARRLLAGDPDRTRIAQPVGGPASHGTLEVVSVRAGSAPGMHLVGFDGPGETVELRLTARDRSAYAAGALAAAAWLGRAQRAAGLHAFDAVVDDLLPADLADPGKRRAVAALAG